MIALLATTLAISDSATAINLTIGNASRDTLVSSFGSDTIGQSFINDPSGTGASILLNNWTFQVNEEDLDYNPFPLFSPDIVLNIYAGTGIGGSPIGSATTYTTGGSGTNSTATWTFTGGLSLIDNQTYTAAVISSANLNFVASSANPYADGIVTRSVSGNLTGHDTVFSANFSSAPTPVPFDFEPTGGLLVLGGGWLLRRHLKKRANKV